VGGWEGEGGAPPIYVLRERGRNYEYVHKYTHANIYTCAHTHIHCIYIYIQGSGPALGPGPGPARTHVRDVGTISRIPNRGPVETVPCVPNRGPVSVPGMWEPSPASQPGSHMGSRILTRPCHTHLHCVSLKASHQKAAKHLSNDHMGYHHGSHQALRSAP